MVLASFFVEFFIFHTNPPFTILFLYNDERGDPLAIINWIEKVGREKFFVSLP